MTRLFALITVLMILIPVVLCEAATTTTGVDEYNRILLNGKPVFLFGFSPGPSFGARTPDGRDALDEFVANGISITRVIAGGRSGSNVDALLKWYEEHGMYAALWLRGDSNIPDKTGEQAKQFREQIRHYSTFPAVAIWKYCDEPAWGRLDLRKMRNGYEIFKEEDPTRLVWMNQAPRNLEIIARYSEFSDLTGMDIYPVSNPKGVHSGTVNKELSTVGDHTQVMRIAVGDRKPIMMVLQVTFSGTLKKRPVLMPTAHQERYMVYQSIIYGARSILFFGMGYGVEGRDRELRWNWTFWENVLKPLLKELAPGSELYPVINGIPTGEEIPVEGADDVDLMARSLDGKLYIIAAKREGAKAEVTFGLPKEYRGKVRVLYENREIENRNGRIKDTFGPNDVHVYCIEK